MSETKQPTTITIQTIQKSDLQSAHTYRCAPIENQTEKTTHMTNSATQFDSNSLRQRLDRHFQPLLITTWSFLDPRKNSLLIPKEKLRLYRGLSLFCLISFLDKTAPHETIIVFIYTPSGRFELGFYRVGSLKET